MNDIQTQIKKQDETIALLRGLLEQMKHGRTQTSNSHANFNFNAGGLGVWTAVWACLATLAACIPLGIVLTITVVDQGRRIDRMQDHLNAVYMMAPQLRPKDDSPK